MRFRKLLAAAAVVFAAGGLAVAAAVPAHAVGHQICGNGGSGYCLNDWGGGTGNGNPVKMYYGGYANDAFEIVYVNACQNVGGLAADQVHAGEGGEWCPFGDLGIDQSLDGSFIFQIWYYNTGNECAATTGNAYVVLGTCARQSDGGGGSNGVINAVGNSSSCQSSNGDFFAVNRYWSDLVGQNEYLNSGGNVGVQAVYGTPGTCWGQV